MNLNLRRNSLWAAIEVMISGLSLLVVYRIVILHLGPKGLGVWSLVLATTSIARLADIGTAASLARFVAIALARGDERQAGNYVDTAVLSNLAFYGVLGAVLYLPLEYGLSLVVPENTLAEALSLLPYAILSLVFLTLNAVMLSALIGGHRYDLKSKIVIVSTFLQIAVVAAGISSLGLIAMAWGQIAQYCVAAVAARVLFVRLVPEGETGFLPLRFSTATFKELFAFGLKLQIANLSALAFEPLMKFAISSTAGLATLGIFELAYRMVLQVRNVVVAPTQALVPVFTHLHETDPISLYSLFEKAVAISILSGASLLTFITLISPLVSWLLIGHVDPSFVLFTAICSLGWFVNLAGAPAYLLGVSRRFIRWNIVGHIVISFAGPITGIVLFHAFGGKATVVMTSMGGLAGGTVISWVMNCRQYGIHILPSRLSFFMESRSAFQMLAGKLNRKPQTEAI